MEEEVLEVLLQFKAGRMNLDGSKVAPDSRKGFFRVARGEDLLLHVQWVERTPDDLPRHVEEDIIVFPDEAEFKRVSQASGRVFLLSFKQDDRKFFFWMQEPDSSRDDMLCEQVNQRMNQSLEEVAEEEEDGEEMLMGMDTEKVAAGLGTGAAQRSGTRTEGQVVGTGAGSGVLGSLGGVQMDPAAAARALAASLQMAQFQNLVSGLAANIAVPQELLAGAGKGGGGVAQWAVGAKEPGLTEVLCPQVLLPVLNDPDVITRLTPHLPQALQSKEEMQQLVQSPQFQQQLDTLSLLLRTGRIDLAQFGIDANKHGYGVISFLKAIQEQTPVSEDKEGLPQGQAVRVSANNNPVDGDGSDEKPVPMDSSRPDDQTNPS